VHQNYALDVIDFRLGSMRDGVLRFSRGGEAAAALSDARRAA
jgi:hypothetical protein